MKYFLILAMAVLVTAKPLDDEWEQFKKVNIITSCLTCVFNLLFCMYSYSSETLTISCYYFKLSI